MTLRSRDTLVFQQLCNIIYFRNPVFSSDTSLLAALTDLCDKYQCASAVRFYVTVWMSALDSYANTVSNLLKFIWVSYVLAENDEDNQDEKEKELGETVKL